MCLFAPVFKNQQNYLSEVSSVMQTKKCEKINNVHLMIHEKKRMMMLRIVSKIHFVLFIMFQVVIVGNGAVGKSSMIQRYCKGIFTRNYKKTIGVDFLEKHIT